jgi:probable F420-dependent oxidoreductase
MVYAPPLAAMSEYLDGLEHAPYFGGNEEMPPIVLAALGPRMLTLSRDRAAGAHPYLVTPDHTRTAREILGNGPLLVVEQAAVLNESREESLRRAHEHLSIYTGLPNYRNNWLREGFTDDDLVRGGSDKLADSLVAIGNEEAVLERVTEHLDAGADHVCAQFLGADMAEAPLLQWRSMAAAIADMAP